MKRKQTEILSDHDFIAMVHNTYLTPIKLAIKGILNNKRPYMDCAVDEDDVYSQVLLALIEKGYAAKLQQKPTTATARVKSRLVGFARRTTLNHLKKIKNRHRIISENPYARAGKYCEAFTPKEMASIKADEAELAEA